MSDPDKLAEMVVVKVWSQWVGVQKRKSTHRLLFKNTLVGKGRIERRWWPEAAGSAGEDNVREGEANAPEERGGWWKEEVTWNKRPEQRKEAHKRIRRGWLYKGTGCFFFFLWKGLKVKNDEENILSVFPLLRDIGSRVVSWKLENWEEKPSSISASFKNEYELKAGI